VQKRGWRQQVYRILHFPMYSHFLRFITDFRRRWRQQGPQRCRLPSFRSSSNSPRLIFVAELGLVRPD
jgi:hypothetical protein